MNAKKGVKGFIKVSVEQRFWAGVDRRGDDECWPWRSAVKYKYGYGSLVVEGRNRKATQISWELFNKRPFPAGTMACHSCDYPPCVNPRHIWPGTAQDNLQDAQAKGRLNNKPPRSRRPDAETHCKHGHEYTPENTIIVPPRRINYMTLRKCRTCEKRWTRIGEKNRTARRHAALAKWKAGV